MKKMTIILAVVSATLSLAFRTAPSETFNVSTSESTVKWTGYHLAKSYEHSGNLQIKSGTIDMNENTITSGEIIIDMNTLTNSDLTSKGKKAKLEKHLKSDDFFDVEKFPEAKIVINSADSEKIQANITIKGITKPIEFGYTINGNTVSATILIQRTEFKVMYGWSVENAMLSEEFKLDVELVVNK